MYRHLADRLLQPSWQELTVAWITVMVKERQGSDKFKSTLDNKIYRTGDN